MAQTRHSRRTGAAAAWIACSVAAVVTTGLLACGESGNAPDGGTAGEQTPPAVPAEGAPAEEVVDHASETLGAVEVRSVGDSPVDWFDVLQDGERAFAGNPPLLNSTLELPPGTYVVDVNRTQREVTLEAGKKTVLRTGELVVEGEPSHAFWYPMQGGERKLSSNPSLLNSARALFPGTYEVFVYVSVTTGDEPLGEAEVRPGATTVVEE